MRTLARLSSFPLFAALGLGSGSLDQRGGSSLPRGTSAISGIVMDAVSRLPIAGCTVTISHLVKFRASGGAVVMRPRTRELWAVTARPSEAPYERYDLSALTT